MNTNKAALIILDGWGIEENVAINAIKQAETPYYDHLIANFPNNTLTTFGENVGLPEGQMGNSEVGHLNLGAGRVVYQELARINKSFKDRAFEKIDVVKKCIQSLKESNKPIHLIGLVSDGGVHSHLNHLIALCKLFSKHQIHSYLHLITDGRDTSPHSSIKFIKALKNSTKPDYVHISTIIGRYYAMDRDKRWERIKKAYDLIVNGFGETFSDFEQAILEAYENDMTDEFLPPLKSVSDFKPLADGETALFINFRTDRPRQLTEALTQSDFHEFNMHKLDLTFITMTEYKDTYDSVIPIFTKDNISNTIGEIISKNGLSQLRIAETEKYPHVTFFFNGGREQPYEGEDRIMIDSPKVATYDLKPDMSAYELTDSLTTAIKTSQPEFIVANFANTDMVGHTGVMSAAIKAAKTVDNCLMKLIPLLQEHKYHVVILADHGNADIMIKPDGSPHTAHTTNPVPIIMISNTYHTVEKGKLGDIAPTILNMMNVDIPKEMDGDILVK